MKTTLTLVAELLLITSLVGCNPAQTTNEAPWSLQRRWIETSDDIVVGFTHPDTIVVAADAIVHLQYIDEEASYRTHDCPIHQVIRRRNEFEIGCQFNSIFLVYYFSIEDSGVFARVRTRDYSIGRFTARATFPP